MKIHMAADVREVLGPSAGRLSNPGLLADRFPGMPDDDKDKVSRSKFLERLCRTPADAEGRKTRLAFFETALPAGSRALHFRVRLGARLIVNQAAGVIENAGLALDRHFGHPYIPGSALKGVARATAVAAAREGESDLREALAVFGWARTPQDTKLLAEAGVARAVGDASFAGVVSFLPSHPAGDAPLTLDIVNCHHPAYYSGKSAKSLDTELPVPNVFPVVEAGCEFVVALALARGSDRRVSTARRLLGLDEDFDPLARAKRWVIAALEDRGVGAKTASGYGWFAFDVEAEERHRLAEEKRRREEAELRRKEEEEARRLAGLSLVERALEEIRALDDPGFAEVARTLAEKTADQQRAFIRILREERKNRLKMWTKRKPDLAAAIRAVAADLGEDLS